VGALGRHQLVAVLRDEGVGGSNGIETREALPEALALLKDGQAKGLVVYRLDGFGPFDFSYFGLIPQTRWPLLRMVLIAINNGT
jgi:hypothetical protein